MNGQFSTERVINIYPVEFLVACLNYASFDRFLRSVLDGDFSLSFLSDSPNDIPRLLCSLHTLAFEV